MPIFLDQLSANPVPQKTWSPKFFDSKLTGQGKNIGILSKNLNPVNVQTGLKVTPDHRQLMRRTYTNGATEVRIVPVNPVPTSAANYTDIIDVPADRLMSEPIAVAKSPVNGASCAMRVYMTPHAVIMEETKLPPDPNAGTQSSRLKKNTIVSYQIHLFSTADPADRTARGANPGLVNAINEADLVEKFSSVCLGRRAPMDFSGQTIAPMANNHLTLLTADPVSAIKDILLVLGATGDWDLKPDAADAYIAGYSVYDAMCYLSEIWQTKIQDVYERYLRSVSSNPSMLKRGSVIETISRSLTYLENHPVPLDICRDIYRHIVAMFPADLAHALCKQNLNLLLSDTLEDLDRAKPNLQHIDPAKANTPLPARTHPFSFEQEAAIKTIEPLALIQSGAGCGKSSTILGRIDWMIAAGVDPGDIMVLSFTNAAADHISDLNPQLHSMTIAKMIHSIYSLNFPAHELSTLKTLINSLEIYYPNDDVAMQFKRHCADLDGNRPGAFIRINTFVEQNYDQVIAMLDKMRQTTLELEIILCYQQIDFLQEPTEVASKHLIIDEVQDNSIFEFVYTLRYVRKHNESLFIVGDCSQTLYEFRGSEPKALNVMEGSGVFSTYQLQTNYRSNQEILDFANILLKNIEANQYANIQLRANALDPVDKATFQDRVHLSYTRLQKKGDLYNMMPTLMANVVAPYVDSKVAKGEKVAILAYKRNDVRKFQEHMQKLRPTYKVVNIVPEKTYDSTVFSAFIRQYWQTIQFSPSKNIMDVIENEIYAHVSFLYRRMDPNKALAKANEMVTKWRAKYVNDISAWVLLYLNGAITNAELMDSIKKTMLDFEIDLNAVKHRMTSMRNEENKLNQDIANANVLVATIHSTKGLEFDNTVVLYDATDSSAAEDAKRMYYVALTRAMHSELILAYGTLASPRIVSDYQMVLNALPDPVITTATLASTPVSDAPQAPALSYDFLAKGRDAGEADGGDEADAQITSEPPQNPLAGLVPVTDNYTATQPEAAPACSMAATEDLAAIKTNTDCDDTDEGGSDPASFLSMFGITVSGGSDAYPPIAS